MSEPFDDPPFTFEYFLPPPDLAQHINALYKLIYAPRTVEELLPAFPPQLLLSDGPAGRIDFGSGYMESPRFASMLGQMTNALPISMEGPTVIYGASFSLYGWAAITELPVLQLAERHIDAETGLGVEVGQKAIELGKVIGTLSTEEAIKRVCDVLRVRAKPLPEGHGRLISMTHSWLQSSFNPNLDDLYDLLAYSKRQTQRLVKQFFGLPPATLRRQYRALRAAALLASPDTDEETRASIYDGFFDQAHMIREIRHFTGRTPRLLSSGEITFASLTLSTDGIYKVADGDLEKDDMGEEIANDSQQGILH